jgi:hypothetical protein
MNLSVVLLLVVVILPVVVAARGMHMHAASTFDHQLHTCMLQLAMSSLIGLIFFAKSCLIDAVLTCTYLNKCPRMPGSEPYICHAMQQDQYPDGENLTLAAANSWAAVTKGCAFQFTATKVASNHADTTAPTTTTATVTGSNAGALTIAPPRQRRRLLLLALRRPIKQRSPARLNKNN